jgi:hypothetical protein
MEEECMMHNLSLLFQRLKKKLVEPKGKPERYRKTLLALRKDLY